MRSGCGRRATRRRPGGPRRLHTGECELAHGKLRGIAVHVGARIAAEADTGEILVSSTVKDLVAGSGLDFQDRGEYHLKGITGPIRLYSSTRVTP